MYKKVNQFLNKEESQLVFKSLHYSDNTAKYNNASFKLLMLQIITVSISRPLPVCVELSILCLFTICWQTRNANSVTAANSYYIQFSRVLEVAAASCVVPGFRSHFLRLFAGTSGHRPPTQILLPPIASHLASPI